MSKTLPEEALGLAVSAWAWGMLGSANHRDAIAAAITAYLRHLKAHGVKLTPREPTTDLAQQYADLWDELWTAAPDWPGDAE